MLNNVIDLAPHNTVASFQEVKANGDPKSNKFALGIFDTQGKRQRTGKKLKKNNKVIRKLEDNVSDDFEVTKCLCEIKEKMSLRKKQ